MFRSGLLKMETCQNTALCTVYILTIYYINYKYQYYIVITYILTCDHGIVDLQVIKEF